MEKKNSDKFYVTKYGPRYAVRYPDGLIRCIVKSEEFAEEICHELNDEVSKTHGYGKQSILRRMGNPVICTTTGERFCSVAEASRATGVDSCAIRKDCNHITRSIRSSRPRFEWAEATA